MVERSSMRLRADQLLKRTVGTLVGLGFLTLGLFSVFGSADLVHEINRDRAFWFGITSIVIGLIAIAASLDVKNLDEIWCRHPGRWGSGWRSTRER